MEVITLLRNNAPQDHYRLSIFSIPLDTQDWQYISMTICGNDDVTTSVINPARAFPSALLLT
jgi:hypothetical protein